jgi:hypothetical protein
MRSFPQQCRASGPSRVRHSNFNTRMIYKQPSRSHTHKHAPNTKPKDVDKLGSGPSIPFHSGQAREDSHVHTTSPFSFLHLFPSSSPSSYTAKTFALHSKHVLEHSRRATFVTTHLTFRAFAGLWFLTDIWLDLKKRKIGFGGVWALGGVLLFGFSLDYDLIRYDMI